MSEHIPAAPPSPGFSGLKRGQHKRVVPGTGAMLAGLNENLEDVASEILVIVPTDK